MTDKPDFNADSSALQIADGLNTGDSYDHVVPVAVVAHQDHYRLSTGRAGHKCIAIGHRYCVELAGGKGLHRGGVIKPLKLYLKPCLSKPLLFNSNFPGYPTGPIAVTNDQRIGKR